MVQLTGEPRDIVSVIALGLKNGVGTERFAIVQLDRSVLQGAVELNTMNRKNR